MGRIIVNVMPTIEASAAAAAERVPGLRESGFERLSTMREGRRYYLYVEGDVTEDDLAKARALAESQFVDPKTEKITGLFVGETPVIDEDDEWDYFEEGIGAIAPIPKGAGMHDTTRRSRANIDFDRLADVTLFPQPPEA